MSYEKDDVLQLIKKGETIVLQGRPSLFLLSARLAAIAIAVVGLWIIFAYSMSSLYVSDSKYIVEIAVLIVGGLLALIILAVWYKTYYIVTNRRVRYYSGVLGVQNKDMSINDVENVRYQQGILGTIFNYGDITIHSAAEDNPILFAGIPSPKKFADEIRDLSKRWHRRSDG